MCFWGGFRETPDEYFKLKSENDNSKHTYIKLPSENGTDITYCT